MSKTAHTIFLSLQIAIVFITFIVLTYNGLSYYQTSIEDRVHQAGHARLKPSGIVGHGLGIFGTISIIIGVSSYMARKRYRFLSRIGLVKYWLEFHIFLCTLGPVLILFHTAYKFGGLVAISFWSMIAVFLSGIIGRFIYIQIPHSTEGRELDISEIRELTTDATTIVGDSIRLDVESLKIISESLKRKVELFHINPFAGIIRNYIEDRNIIKSVRESLKRNNVPRSDFIRILTMVTENIKLNRRIEKLGTMRNLFKYWHVAHLPLALIMLIIMVIHVVVAILFGYRWIF